jgi:hypothetical protein
MFLKYFPGKLRVREYMVQAECCCAIKMKTRCFQAKNVAKVKKIANAIPLVVITAVLLTISGCYC